jgi:TolB-like protein/tetratricopeptide (TPR) repeat protein
VRYSFEASALETPVVKGQEFGELIDALQKRHVFRVAASYAIVAFVILQLAEIVFPAFELADAAIRSLVISAIGGFPLTLGLAWFVEGKLRSAADDGESILPRSAEAGIILTVLTVATGIGFLTTYEPGRGTTGSDGPSIAVMPFVDLSADGRFEYFGDGMAEELLNMLSRVDGLHVAARTSSFAFKGQNQDIRDIGRELSVGTVLEGSVRGAGDTVRITAQLIDVETGFHIWSETYDREWADVFAVQDEISSHIVAALRSRLLDEGIDDAPAIEAPTRTAGTEDSVAYQSVLQGRFQLQQRTAESIEAALGLFQQAVDEDPEYVAAYAGLADAYVLSNAYGNLTLDQALPKATLAVAEALRRDDQRADVYASLGLIRMTENRQDEAEQLFVQAIQLDPSYAMAHMWRGNNLNNQQRFDEALESYREAYELDPYSKPVNINMVNMLQQFGLYDELPEHLNKLIRLDVDRRAAWMELLAGIRSQRGEVARAIHDYRSLLAEFPDDVDAMAELARNLMILGDMESAEVWVQRAERISAQDPSSQQARVQLLVARGDLATLHRTLEAQLARDGLQGNPQSLPLLIITDAAIGDQAHASEHMTALRAAVGGEFTVTRGANTELLSIVGSWLASQDDPAEGLRIAQATLETFAEQRLLFDGYLSSGELIAEVRAYLALGRDDGALGSMRAAIDAGWRDLWVLGLDPGLSRLFASGEGVALRARIESELTAERSKLAAVSLAAYTEPERPVPASIPRASYVDLVGYYQPISNANNMLQIYEQDGQLLAKNMDETLPLHIWPAAADRFFAEERNDRFQVFRDAVTGEITHLIRTRSGQNERLRRVEYQRPEVISLHPTLVDRYLGDFQFDNFLMSISRDGGQLYVQQDGQARVEIYPKSDTEFFLDVASIELRFRIDRDGTVDDLILAAEGGVELEGQRVEQE